MDVIRGRGQDEAQVFALEAVICALMMVGAVAVLLPATDSPRPERIESRIETAALDALRGMELSPSQSLQRALRSGIECDSPSRNDSACSAERAAFARALGPHVTPGTHVQLSLSNGLAQMHLYDKVTPPGSAATASVIVTPDWRFTFTTTDLACHDPAVGLRVHMLPLDAGSPRRLRDLQVAGDAVQPNRTATWQEVNLSAPTAPVSRLHVAAADAYRSYPGHADLTPCALGAAGTQMREGLAQSSAWVENHVSAFPGAHAVLRYDLTPLSAAVPNLTIRSVALDVYQPIPSLTGRPAVLALEHPLEAATTGAFTWNVPRASIYGHHPIVVRALVEVPTETGMQQVEVRLVTAIAITLPGGHLPVEPLYRISLTTWHAEVR